MSNLKCDVVSITRNRNRISLESVQPVPFRLGLDEIEQRIVRAYMRLMLRADTADSSRTASVTRTGLLEVRMTQMPPELLTPGRPLFLLEVFSLPNHSSVDSFGIFELDEKELATAAAFVLGAALEVENKSVVAVQ